MKSFFAEPLTQFLILGLILFLLVDSFAPENLVLPNDHEIMVDNDKLLAYYQFQNKKFNRLATKNVFQSMSSKEKSTLKNSYIRDEVLYREAIALSLNDNDEIIRRRLIQKMEYVMQGFYEDIPAATETELNAFFHENIDRYKISPAITFTHVFIEKKSNHDKKSKIKAELQGDELNELEVSFEKAGQYGDRYLYNLNYIERTPDYIASHFGEAFQSNLFLLDSSRQWQGPIQSTNGFHLVLIRKKTAARTPALDEVANIVLADLQDEQQREQRTKAITELISQYKVKEKVKDMSLAP